VLTRAGVQLVSCSENIDETPSGMLLHGIMSSIAEFYSRNLATESPRACVKKLAVAAHRAWRHSATAIRAFAHRKAARCAPSRLIPNGLRLCAGFMRLTPLANGRWCNFGTNLPPVA
jgi:Resolvase, N terminal domain